MCKKNGFTLIELLVVIAIIGVLASIVLFNIGDARRLARDAVIRAEINSASKRAEIFYYEYGDYDQLCDEPEFVGNGAVIKAITDNGGTFVCGDGANGFCISSTLNMGGSVCADKIGRLKEGTVCSGASDIACP